MSTSNPVLADAIAHETDGVLSYSGALAVLQDAAKSAMSATLFSELTAVADDLNASGGVSTSAYVQQIFDNVVLGNSANADWNGGSNNAVALGDLSASSTATQFDELIGKWFLGTDLPGVSPEPGQNSFYPTSYVAYSTPLFTSAGPAITDVSQGQVGDCWFLAALGETAMLDPSLIENMIVANGNGSYSVRFEVDGKADYVTVNNQLSTYSGGVEQFGGSRMEFANSTTCLWAPLIEKALAELSEQSGVVTGMQYAGGDDQYYELNAGAGEGVSLITGQAYSDCYLGNESSSAMTKLLGTLQAKLAAGDDVMLGTSDDAVSGNLVDDHMFAVTAVNAAAGTVTLYNPWGSNASGQGKAESFSIAASALISDQAWFYWGVGAPTVPSVATLSATGVDFYDSGSSSVLFNNGSQLADWEIKDGELVGTGFLGDYGGGFNEVGTGDFYGDGTSDVLFFNSSNGQLVDYTVSDGVQSGSHTLGYAGAGWSVAGTGDFYGDGTSDILFQNASTGGVVDYKMSGGSIVGEVYVGTAAGYKVVGTGDFNGDGATDILFENGSGQLVDWQMRAGAVTGGGYIGSVAAGWSVVGTGDFYGSGTSDILFQNASTGAVAMWRMANGEIESSNVLAASSAGSVVGTGYFHNSGAAASQTSDILFQSASGAVYDWQMQDGEPIGAQTFGTVASGWRAS